MNKITKLVALAMMSITRVGCGAIDTNNAGVRTTWDNQVKPDIVKAGFFTSVISNVDEWVGKEIMIELQNMTPKAGDNLTMEDLDVEIYYTAALDAMPGLKTKYANAHVTIDNYTYPAFRLVQAQGREAVYKATAELDSLLIHKKRNALSKTIISLLQDILNTDDPGVFIITKVIIKQAETDKTLEESIQLAIKKEKELEAKQKEVEIKAQEALANIALSDSLTPNIMRLKELDAMVEACNGKDGAGSENICILDFTGGQTGVKPLINTPARKVCNKVKKP